MRIVALSDTHGYHKKLTIPDGDLLIHCGDFSMRAKLRDVVEFSNWMKSLPHKHKIVVVGNHDVYCEANEFLTRAEFSPMYYLNHQLIEIEGYRIFGSPYSPGIYEPSDWVFDYPPNGKKSEQLWSQIPSKLDVLITHGPPKGILDRVTDINPGEDYNVGDVNLLYYVKQTHPKVHIFGHIHEGAGSYVSDCWTTRFYNVCICDGNYRPTNPITVIDL